MFQSCWSFFFVKQKTAYEMRISDWSSDVCSSDLPCPSGLDLQQAGRKALVDADRAAGRVRNCPFLRRQHDHARHFGAFGGGGPARRQPRLDRKSVVSGKSVSVRVDLGGRRIIKKKNKKMIILRNY